MDGDEQTELLKGIYVTLLQIKDYQWAMLQAMDSRALRTPHEIAEQVSDLHEAGQLVLELPSLSLEVEKD